MEGPSNNGAFEPTEPVNDDATTPTTQVSVNSTLSGHAANRSGCNPHAGTRSAHTCLRR